MNASAPYRSKDGSHNLPASLARFLMVPLSISDIYPKCLLHTILTKPWCLGTCLLWDHLGHPDTRFLLETWTADLLLWSSMLQGRVVLSKKLYKRLEENKTPCSAKAAHRNVPMQVDS